jgi:hypothetical protein
MRSELVEAVVRDRRLLIERAIRTVAIAVVVFLVIGFAVLSLPSPKNGPSNATDFATFYCAGRMVRQGFGDRLYDVAEQSRCLSAVPSTGVYYLRPPFESLLFIPLSYLNYRRAYLLWTLASVLLLVISAHFIELETVASSVITRHTKIRADLGLLVAIFVTFSPFTTGLMLGQDAALVLLIYTLAFVLQARGREVGAGLVLGCALFKFQMVIPLALILVLRRKWHALGGFLASGVFLVLVSIAIAGRQVLTQYPRFLLNPGRDLNLLGLDPWYMPNVRGFLSLLLGNFCSTRSIAMLTLSVSFLLLCLAARIWKDDQPKLSLGVALLASLLSTYHLHNYDLTLLLLAVPMVWTERLSRAAKWAVVAMFLPPLHLFLITHGIYTLMVAPITVLLLSAISVLRAQGDWRANADLEVVQYH